MKPIQLTMTAFGPYKGTEVIDFGRLKEHRLFVVSGATGAGKTTIFDGICFALYGQASGEDRTDFRSLRSDFADDSVPTSVELIFQINRRVFRIMRQIPYLKSGNKNETSAKCELFELTTNGEVPFVDRQIVSEINPKIEEMVGFTQAQFSQIVMLPQGEFRKFLTSDTENKETIMRKIFKTQEYREIVDALKVKKDEATLLLSNEERNVENIIQQIPTIIPARESLIFEVLSNEYATSMQVMNGLEQESGYYKDKVSEDETKYNAAYQEHADMLAAYHAAKNCNEQFAQLEQRKLTLEKLTEEIPAIQLKDKRIANADRAAVIHEIESYYISQAEEETKKRTELDNAIAFVQEAKNQLDEVEKMYKEIEEKEQLRVEVTEKLIRLRDHLPSVTDLAAKEANVQQLKDQLQKMEVDFARTSEKTNVEKVAVVNLKVQIEKLEEEITPYDKFVETLNVVQVQYKIAQEYEKLTNELMEREQQRIKWTSTFKDTKNEFENLQHKWLSDQASRLAETLIEGDPCPVCGSTHHTSKSRSHDGDSISREELDVKRKQLTEVESTFRSAEVKYESIREQLTMKENEIKEQKIKDTIDVLQAKRQGILERVAILKNKRDELFMLKEQFKKTEAEATLWDNRRSELEKMLFEQSAFYEKESALLQREISAIPEGLQDLAVLQKEIIDTQTQKRQLDEAWIAIQKKREDAKERLATSTNSQLYVKQALEESSAKRKLAEDRFHMTLKASDFSTEEEYRKAKMPEMDKRLLKDQVIQFNQHLHTTREAIRELEANLIGKMKMDLDELLLKVNLLKETYEKALTDWNNSTEFEKALCKLKHNLRKSSEGIEELERKVSKLIDLYDVIRGQNHHKLSFERFIQIDYLERIIQSANIRLHTLSGGQYELIRSDRQEMRGRQSGLGLDVYDAYTGQNRDVKTLSGGEKFNASLSLALGMADVIQSFQGAVSIDTMFIDEGFGTLDEESLHKAVDTLIDLQKSGRMIGVISHVEELKAAFPAILEVRKSSEGHSETKFVIK